MKKHKVKPMLLQYSWTCNEEQKELLNRAIRALNHAKIQYEFWKSEAEFWENRTAKIKEYYITLKDKTRKNPK